MKLLVCVSCEKRENFSLRHYETVNLLYHAQKILTFLTPLSSQVKSNVTICDTKH